MSKGITKIIKANWDTIIGIILGIIVGHILGEIIF